MLKQSLPVAITNSADSAAAPLELGVFGLRKRSWHAKISMTQQTLCQGSTLSDVGSHFSTVLHQIFRRTRIQTSYMFKKVHWLLTAVELLYHVVKFLLFLRSTSLFLVSLLFFNSAGGGLQSLRSTDGQNRRHSCLDTNSRRPVVDNIGFNEKVLKIFAWIIVMFQMGQRDF